MIGKLFSNFFELKKIHMEQKRLISMRRTALNELESDNVKVPFGKKEGKVRRYNFVQYDEVRSFYVLCLGNSKKIENSLKAKYYEMRQYAKFTRSLLYSVKIAAAFMALTGVYLLISILSANVTLSATSIVSCFVVAGMASLVLQSVQVMFWDWLINMCGDLIEVESKAYEPFSRWYLEKIEETKMNA